MKVSFAIPFLASKYTSALDLCIKSIARFCKYENDIYLQIDVSNSLLANKFDVNKITSLSNKIHYRLIEHFSSGSYKNQLINWVCEKSDSDFIIVLHSDVVFFGEETIKKLIDSLVSKPSAISSFWTIPFVEYKSTYHIDDSKKKNFYVAPRISSWLFSINRVRFLETKKEHNEFENCFLGHFWLSKDIFEYDFFNWLTEKEKFNDYKQSNLDCLVDIGSFFLYLLEKYKLDFVSLGVESNPSFENLKFKLRDDYVHVEQYDPQRFNNSLYSSALLDVRTKMIDLINNNNFDLEKCKDVFF